MNAVNNESKTPLGLLRDRLERELNEAKRESLRGIEAYLVDRGAITDWKKLPKW